MSTLTQVNPSLTKNLFDCINQTFLSKKYNCVRQLRSLRVTWHLVWQVVLKYIPICFKINEHLNFIGVQDAFNQSNEYQLSDCASYFLSNARRISHSGYVPSTQDILHTRVRTCGVVEVKIP